MGSSETEEGMVDCGIGCIVWVRRRNGSWWPGKILGPDELSTSHVMTPRSGTAVKLLGRDDASVDWYNLEKSKRVKAFRCGEFDDCIERAEASLGMPPKKREKYARREDAIIHALELERQLVGGKNGKTSYSCNDNINKSPDDTVRSEVVTSMEYFENQNQEQLSLKTHKTSERSGHLLKDENGVDTLCGDVGPKGNQLSVDNYSILPPRKRGLQDFGLSAAPSEHKPPVDSSGTNKPFSESTALPDRSPNKVGLINTDKESLLDEKTLGKRHDRRYHPVQVSKSTEKLPVSYPQPDSNNAFTSVSGEEQSGVVCHAKKARYTFRADDSRDCCKINLPTETDISTSKLEGSDCPHPDESCEEKTSGSTECTETDSCKTDSQESDSDDDIATLSEGAASIELQPKYLGRSEAQAEHGSTSSEDSDNLSGADSHPYRNNTVSACVGVSKWLLKGKRNNRGLIKRSLDIYEENHFRRPSYMTNPVEKRSYGGTEANSLMKSRVKMAGYGSRIAGTRNIANWGDLSWNDQRATKEDWGNYGEYLDPLCNYHHLGGQRMLIDVDLKVQAGYKRQSVPLISLTSKKNGLAIVGHPVKIEVLENGSFESLFGAVDDICPETLDDASLQPMWRTARRTTGARVPRPHPSSIEHGRNARKASSTGFGQKASLLRKSASQPPLGKIFFRKPLRNVALSSNQKIRTLSSIASQQKQSCDMKHSFNSFQVDGLIKQESMPTVACIPVKLVFSRLNEELVGRHP